VQKEGANVMRESSRNRIRILVALAIPVAAIPLAVGCGGRTGDVVGQVTCGGKTVTSGSVMIVASDSLAYHGVIDGEGNYTIAKVPTGPGKMAVFSPGPIDEKKLLPPPQLTGQRKTASPKPRPFPGDPDKWFAIPAKYRKFQDSGLTVTVQSGQTRRDLALED
jgi:hypothetical protein